MLQLWHAKIVFTLCPPPSPPCLCTSPLLNTLSFVLPEVAAVTYGITKLEQLDDLCYRFVCVKHYDTKARRPYQDEKLCKAVSFVCRI